MPVSPSWVSGISACHFQNCQSLDKLLIVWVWHAIIRNRENSSWPQLFLPSFSSTSLSKHLTLWKFQCIALEPKTSWAGLFFVTDPATKNKQLRLWGQPEKFNNYVWYTSIFQVFSSCQNIFRKFTNHLFMSQLNKFTSSSISSIN